MIRVELLQLRASSYVGANSFHVEKFQGYSYNHLK